MIKSNQIWCIQEFLCLQSHHVTRPEKLLSPLRYTISLGPLGGSRGLAAVTVGTWEEKKELRLYRNDLLNYNLLEFSFTSHYAWESLVLKAAPQHPALWSRPSSLYGTDSAGPRETERPGFRRGMRKKQGCESRWAIVGYYTPRRLMCGYRSYRNNRWQA